MVKFLMHLLILGNVMTMTEADPFSCPVSKSTVNVTQCPVTEEGWRNRSTIKNCSQYADQCENPDKLVYHCVVNAYVNQTLEVCAIQQYIVWGYCAEYSELGNVIQSNYNCKCATFTSYPCPNFYLSSEAYKYPDCYKLVTTPAPATDSTLSVSTTSIDMSLKTLLTVSVIGIAMVIALAIFLWKAKRSSFRGQHENGTDAIPEMIVLMSIENNVRSQHQEPETGGI